MIRVSRFVATLLVPPARDFFSLAVPGVGQTAIVLAAAIAWVPLIRVFWKRQLIDRFMGIG